MKVTFRPSYDEHVAFLGPLQKKHQSAASQTVSWIYFAFNLGLIPAILLLRDLYWLALLVFAGNSVMAIFLLAWQQRRNLRDYYQRVWPELEDHDCEVTISDAGLSCIHADNDYHYPWRNVRSTGQTEQLVYFDVANTHVIVPKRGFANDVEVAEFVREAQQLKTAATAGGV